MWIEMFAGGLIIGMLFVLVWIAISPRLHKAGSPAVAGPIPRAATGANRNTQPGVAMARVPIQPTIRDPNELLFQARVMPKFEEGRMIGVAVDGIQAGSLLQKMGIQDGDVITQFNGIALDSPAEGARIVKEFANAEQFHLVVRLPNGAEQVRDFAP